MMNEPDEMDRLYGEGDDKSNPEGGHEETPETVDQENADAMHGKAVVPLNVLQSHDKEPVKVGDEIVVKVTGVHGQQAEIMYAPKKGSESGEGMESGKEMTPDEEIDSLNTY